MINTVLTIAGSDCSGGAGIQADLKTMLSIGVYGMSAITALTAQNTMGVFDISEVSPEFLRKEIQCIFEDIRPNSVKIGMVSSIEIIDVIVESLKFYKAKNIVVDPVMVSTSGSKLLNDNAIERLKTKLFPLADILTPNIPEAIVLSNIEIKNDKDMEIAARKISNTYKASVLLKGGHSINDANDFFYSRKDKGKWYKSKRIDNKNTHGTGCTLSSAIASYLAKGESLEDSIAYSKDYISGALSSMLDLGKGSGPVDHMWKLKKGVK